MVDLVTIALTSIFTGICVAFANDIYDWIKARRERFKIIGTNLRGIDFNKIIAEKLRQMGYTSQYASQTDNQKEKVKNESTGST